MQCLQHLEQCLICSRYSRKICEQVSDPASALLMDHPWPFLACRIKTSLSMAFRAFLDLPQPGSPESSYILGICPSVSQARCLRIATTFPGFARAFPPLRFCSGHSLCAEYPSLTPHLNPSLSGRLPGKACPPITLPFFTSHQYRGHPHLTGALPGWGGAESSLGPQRASQNCLFSCPTVHVKALGPEPRAQEKWGAGPRLPQTPCTTSSPNLCS